MAESEPGSGCEKDTGPYSIRSSLLGIQLGSLRHGKESSIVIRGQTQANEDAERDLDGSPEVDAENCDVYTVYTVLLDES